MQNWLDDNDILMFWTHNDGKSVIIAETFLKSLKGKFYKNDS